MYDAVPDPYCYADSTVLRNLVGLRTQDELDAFEAAATTLRADEPLPEGRLSLTHYRAIHRHLFQDVYAWAGVFRTVRLGKGGSAFCYPEHIVRQMKAVFADFARNRHLQGLTRTEFAALAAEFLATLNAIHPFREGNGRTQTLFLALLADRAGHPLDFDRLEPEAYLAAMVKSFEGDNGPLVEQLEILITR